MLQILAPERLVSRQSSHSPREISASVPECPLFSKADVQIVGNQVKLRSAFGQKRTFTVAHEILTMIHLSSQIKITALNLDQLFQARLQCVVTNQKCVRRLFSTDYLEMVTTSLPKFPPRAISCIAWPVLSKEYVLSITGLMPCSLTKSIISSNCSRLPTLSP